MGNQLGCDCTKAEPLREGHDPKPVPYWHLQTGGPCSVELRRPHRQKDHEVLSDGCDPAGTVFEDTLAHLGELEQLAFSFAGSLNIVGLRWCFVFGVLPTVRDSNRTTLLHVACRRGSHEVVEELLRRGIDPDAEDCAGWTPLHVSSCMGRKSVSVLLLRFGANPHRQNARGQTPEVLCSDPSTKEAVEGFNEANGATEMALTAIGRQSSGTWSTSSPSSLHFEPFFVPRDAVLQEPKHREDLKQIGLEIFNNRNSGEAIGFLVATGVVQDFPVEINNFLLRRGANPTWLGEFHSEDFPIAKTLRLEFISSLQLRNSGVVSALGTAQQEMVIPSDWLKADRILTVLAHFWWRQHLEEDSLAENPPESDLPPVRLGGELVGMELQRSLSGIHALHMLFFSALMLHRWLRAGNQMSFSTWEELNQGIMGNNLEDGLDIEIQRGIYRAVLEGGATCTALACAWKVPKALAPTLSCVASVRYKSRPRSSASDPAHWVEESPQALAAGGGILSAGRMSLTTRSDAHSTEAGSCSEELDEDICLRLYQWLLLLSTPESGVAPFAFISLKGCQLVGADADDQKLTIKAKEAGAAALPGTKFVELCLILRDGRFQLLEAPELVLRFNEQKDYNRWVSHLADLCCEDQSRRFAAIYRGKDLAPDPTVADSEETVATL
eukprot:TRINITY_DN111118_c0_g1_i1.p1 TRINITY_DN111118_c0_g1~~TRINITY_DN111118_c0_g1_i1.p1  ORF type:complete len:668 (-),score=131.65 TRINITY_DN111118_c0_g1_i1:111-2114(-)